MGVKKAAKKPVARKRTVKKIVDAPIPEVAAVEPIAQGDGDPAPISREEFNTLTAELDRLRALVIPDAKEPEDFTVNEHGQYVAPKGSRELFIRIHGARYEHVGETPDGRWVYAQS